MIRRRAFTLVELLVVIGIIYAVDAIQRFGAGSDDDTAATIRTLQVFLGDLGTGICRHRQTNVGLGVETRDGNCPHLSLLRSIG